MDIDYNVWRPGGCGGVVERKNGGGMEDICNSVNNKKIKKGKNGLEETFSRDNIKLANKPNIISH